MRMAMQFDIKEPDSVNLKKNQENWQKWCKSCPRIVQIWNEFSKNSLILIKISNISFLNWIMTLQNSFLNWITCVVKIWFTRKTFLIWISFLFSSFLNRILTVLLLSKPYVNGVTLREQKWPLKYCQPLDFSILF